MILREATQEVFESLLKTGKFRQAIDEKGDYVYICAHVFNAGWYATIKSYDYDEKTAEEAASRGQLFIDKDDALQMLTDFQLDIEYEPEGQG